jgi:hypothetical protein
MKSPLRAFAWTYAALFLFVVALGYIPGVTDDQGLMFGLFKIDPIDDALHFLSAVWAGLAAWRSLRATVIFFKTFGTLYFLDGVVGILTGEGYLDLSVFLAGAGIPDFPTRIAANLPHILIGGVAVIVGFLASRKRTEK